MRLSNCRVAVAFSLFPRLTSAYSSAPFFPCSHMRACVEWTVLPQLTPKKHFCLCLKSDSNDRCGTGEFIYLTQRLKWKGDEKAKKLRFLNHFNILKVADLTLNNEAVFHMVSRQPSVGDNNQ